MYSISVRAAAAHDISVFGGVSATTTYEAVQMATHAVSAGCRGVMLGLPPYVRPTDGEVSSYVQAVYEAIPKECSILLYNNVMRNGGGPSKECLVSLYQRGLICGIKHANYPQSLFLQESKDMLQLEPNLKLYTGSDVMSGNLLCGSQFDSSSDIGPVQYHGLTSIIGNVFPEDICAVVAGLAGKFYSHKVEGISISIQSIDEAVQAQQKIAALAACVLSNSSVPVGLKFAMRSIAPSENVGGWPRLPLGELSHAKSTEILAALSLYSSHPTNS